MWPDNDTDVDFLNFTGVSDTVAEIILQADGRPISIGVDGAWGVGKSSLIRLIRKSLESRSEGAARQFIFVEFNAWLYQGYDDARAALMEVIAGKLTEEAQRTQKGVAKAKEFLERINWFRVAKLAAGSALAISMGMPPIALIGELWGFGKNLVAGNVDEQAITNAENAAQEVAGSAAGILAAQKDTSPPKEIHALRAAFEEALEAMGVTLVVLIDDLDRCLPPVTISTLEAIRLFLFLQNTAFVIAADGAMIKHAVRQHFAGPDEELVTNYFDKLIQVPIRVPPLGPQEVRAYMMLLFVENSSLDSDTKERIRSSVCSQLSQTWQGKRVDRAFIESVHSAYPAELIGQFDIAEKLAPLMTTSSNIAGNPRLIKRFLNALAIRKANARTHGVSVDEAVLVKMLLFERIGNAKCYEALTVAVSENADGKPAFLGEWEEKALAGEELKLESPWDETFVIEWLRLSPTLADQDLRGVLYVSREHAPLLRAEDRLSSEAAELLTALLQHPDMAGELKDRLEKLSRAEATVIMDRLLDRARQEQEWGVPPILEACLAISSAESSQGARLSAFLAERPSSQVRPNIVPKISDQPWAGFVFEQWTKSTGLSGPVRVAIKNWQGNGNVPVQ